MPSLLDAAPITEFEQLGSLRPGDIQALMRNTRKGDFAPTLKGASEPLSSIIFRNIAFDAGQSLREEMRGQGDIRQEQIVAAQAALMKTANELAALFEVSPQLARHGALVRALPQLHDPALHLSSYGRRIGQRPCTDGGVRSVAGVGLMNVSNRNYHVPLFVPFLDIPVSFDDLLQWIASIDHRS